MHNHSHNHTHDHQDIKNIKTAFFLNFGFTILEFVGGFYVNSVAIISDAIHDLGDSLSLLSSWYFQKLSHKGRTHSFSYGYKRFSVLSAIINSMVLLGGSVFILIETIPRIISPEQPDTHGMILLSILGIIVNGAAVLKTRKGKSMNERVVSLHLLEDVLGWITVLIGSIVMTFYDIPIIDPILSILIAAYILFNVFKNLFASFKIILQGTPSDLDLNSIKERLMSIPAVKNIHDLHTWSMDGDYHVLTVHLVLHKEKDFSQRTQIKQDARALLEKEAIEHATIELELEGECDTSVDRHD
ncbi:cation diffusion facilitator family transporter [Reichenbachiella ulvae]|uniref:Cation diffusion facilitator family transporter n=1 Tax=Reichenbachiella ulvae TaxID=2980104 RepID=A0ABT3CPK8_9BACT|nr:cation diffusion facilitator family transporter [Reichenbachiella ulvae]MCV9385645.1 cation diffusion facilitator family transporter [Reichenbachiella ulvae]